MGGVDKDPGNRLEHVVHGYPWAELDKATVVDVSCDAPHPFQQTDFHHVGGSSGFLSIALARSHPNLAKMIVQDYEQTVERKAPLSLPSELLGSRRVFASRLLRCPSPVAGADVYSMRHICHDWSSENCAQIIGQIVPVMKPESKNIAGGIRALPSAT